VPPRRQAGSSKLIKMTVFTYGEPSAIFPNFDPCTSWKCSTLDVATPLLGEAPGLHVATIIHLEKEKENEI